MRKRIFIILVTVIAFALNASAQYDKDIFSWRGRNALSEGKYSEAIQHFNVLASLDTLDYWTFFYRGIAKYNLGDLRGAQQDFNTSIRLDPVFTNGYHYRAITYSRSGRYDEALEDLKTAIDLRPGLEGLYYTRGVTYFLAQKFDLALEDFNRYIIQQPKDPSAFLNRGATQLYLKDTTAAMSDYNKAIKLDRFDPEGYIRRGRLRADTGDYTEAIHDMDMAIDLDTTNTYAFFNRALLYYDIKDFNSAMRDLNKVLRDEPGNALTLYNRSLISAQVGNFEDALDDMDRVININPRNVLAYYNRASYFIQMERWKDAEQDYDKAIELYPDFAKAYLNRSYVKNMLGKTRESKKDYDTAQQKVKEYRAKNASEGASFADTTKKYSSLLSLDAEFAQNDFDDELLQHRDIDIRLRPLYKFAMSSSGTGNVALSQRYENPLIDKFISESRIPLIVTNDDSKTGIPQIMGFEAILYGASPNGEAFQEYLKALYDVQGKQYNSALVHYDNSIADTNQGDPYSQMYKGFYYMNRGTLRAEMIDFIASIQNNVQTLTMDDQGAIRARVSDQATQTYDYSEAIQDMTAAAEAATNIPYIYYNLGNLYCLSSQLVESINNYTKAIELYPYMGDAYFNRGLVQVYLKDKEKGCIDLSRAGELGVADAYSVIAKYCEDEKNQ